MGAVGAVGGGGAVGWGGVVWWGWGGVAWKQATEGVNGGERGVRMGSREPLGWRGGARARAIRVVGCYRIKGCANHEISTPATKEGRHIPQDARV